MCEIEAIAYDYTKSILIDAEALSFKPSLIVCGVICSTLDVFILLNYNRD
jgi:hypothetical protein